ncbi:lysozyme inhibitor LprI family protein [Agrobacterium arsenijevicii]|uniref:Periplasmic protein n=1 Tax=Agrobacterium arsenijevicii TaxID=1585697 RepID=A0ABR5DB16_9HYPH|nr:periplasmic protein [Agrobacterium arsenijevicii]
MHLKQILLASGIILAASSLGSPASAASFDCTKPDLAPDEKAICDNRALNDQDVKMVTTFDILTQLMAMGARDTLRDEQSKWLKKRQECSADVACITSAYEERMKRLGEAFQSISRPL